MMRTRTESLRFLMLTRWPWIVAMVLMMLSAAVLGLLGPFFQKVFVDRLSAVVPTAAYGDGVFASLELALADWHPVVILLMAFAAMLAAQWISTAAGLIGVREAQNRQETMGEWVYRKTLSLRLDQTYGQTVGEAVALYATDVRGSTALLDQTIPTGAGVIFPFVCAPIAVQMICGIPVGVTVTMMLAVLSISIYLSIRQSRFFQVFKNLAAERAGLVNEWVQNIRLLRILGWVESYEKKIFRKREEETENRVQMVTNGQIMGAFGSSINFFMNLAAVVALLQIKGPTATPGDYFALLWIFGVFLSRPFRQVPWIFTFTFDAITSLERIERFMRRHPDSLPIDGRDIELRTAASPGQRLRSKSASLIVRGLRLPLPRNPKDPSLTLLDDISFSMQPGEFAAVVGEVGSGKSLLLMSLLGETAATADVLKVGDRELAHASIEERRGFFGFVPQDGFVMSSTLRENVAFRYGVSHENDGGITRALQDAQFDPVSEGVSDGLATEIGERGVNLSGGQRQRVGLARASYITRPIILLDDALSAVDVDTERKLFETLLFGAWAGATRLMVTHRLSVLHKVDRILFLCDGRIVDQGTLSELLARNSRFREFVQSIPQEDSSAPKAIPTERDGETDGHAGPEESR